MNKNAFKNKSVFSKRGTPSPWHPLVSASWLKDCRNFIYIVADLQKAQARKVLMGVTSVDALPKFLCGTKETRWIRVWYYRSTLRGFLYISACVLFSRSFFYSFTHSFTNSPTHPLTHSSIQPFIYLSILIHTSILLLRHVQAICKQIFQLSFLMETGIFSRKFAS